MAAIGKHYERFDDQGLKKTEPPQEIAVDSSAKTAAELMK